jgi:hypothetical protein
MFRPLALALALAASTACSLPAHARDIVTLGVVDRDSGQTLPEYPFRGQHWVAGVPGHRYAVRLTNTSGERVLVVLSVDGVNAVSGQTAAPSQAGYVLGPWESTEIAGWRKSLDDIAQFVFTDLPDSYAARTGRPANVGVVGIAVFREYQPPRPQYSPALSAQEYARDSMAKAAAPAPPAASSNGQMRADTAEAMPQRIGTGHGQREWAPVGQTTFQRMSTRPEQVSQVRYDDANALVAMGVMPPPYAPYARTSPRAFPNRFVADPPRW